MPKRVQPEECAAALAAGDPPRSEDYPDDDDAWHDAQNDWFERWQPGNVLPPPGDKKRRTAWKDLTKKHARHVEAAEALPAATDPAAEEPCAAAAAEAAPAAARAAPAAAPATTNINSREALRDAHRQCLERGVEYSISDTLEELHKKLADAPGVPAPAPFQPARADSLKAPAPAPAIRPAPPEPMAYTIVCHCCGQSHGIADSTAGKRCWLCTQWVCSACDDMPEIDRARGPSCGWHPNPVRPGSWTVRACSACRASGTAQTMPTGVVRHRREADSFVQSDNAVFKRLKSACGFDWPPPPCSLYRFDVAEHGVFRVCVEHNTELPPPSPPRLSCTGATDDDTADAC